MKVESIAAIDIGSNAIRLLINNVEEYEAKKAIKKNAYIRVPVRMGDDVFSTGRIGPEKLRLLTETMWAFFHLMHVFNVKMYKACATSAMREAENGKEIVGTIYRATGLQIDIITGAYEADLVYAAGTLNDVMNGGYNYMHIDVGGGSTEMVVYCDQKKRLARSFPVGTLRILAGAVDPAIQKDMETEIEMIRKDYAPLKIIASGGNINKTLKLLGKKDGDTVSYSALKKFHKELAALTIEERLARYKMNTYRADVIVPALHIFLTVGQLAGAKDYIIPKVGLVDGIIRQLHNGEIKPRLVP